MKSFSGTFVRGERKQRRRHPVPRFAGVFAALLLLTSCGSEAPKAQEEGPTPTPSPEASMFDIGGGRDLYMSCEGKGSPTVLFEAGDSDDSSTWSNIQSEISKQTRTCAYDRAGTGRSVAATGCRDLDDILGDLEALLRASKEKPPYVLVGTSGGGFLMAGFAARHASDVAGMVLLETPKAITIMPPGLKEAIACDGRDNVERRDYYSIEHETWDTRKKLGEFPVRIVSNDYGDQAPEEDDIRTNVVDQRGWLVLSPDSKQSVVTSGHDVPALEPDLSIQLIKEVLAAVSP